MVKAVCLGRTSDKSPRNGLTYQPQVGLHSDCNHRAVRQVFNPLPGYTCPQTAFQDCWHNTDVAVKERHYAEVPTITPFGEAMLERGFALLKKLSRSQGLYPGSCARWTPQQVVDTRKGAKRLTYQRAFDSLNKQGIRRADGCVKVFIKFELGHEFDGVKTVQQKVPRLIQYRPPRFVARLSEFLAPLEHALYALKLNGKKMFAKCLDTYQRAEAIRSMSGPGFELIGLDHSRFDSHVVGKLQDLEHKYYCWVYQGNSELQQLLAYQRLNKCYSRSGGKWTAVDGRMSGDFNTALGNNIINAIVMLGALDARGLLSSSAMLLDGDDSVLSVLQDQFDQTAASYFLEMGLTTKIEERNTAIEGIQFCQSRPVETGSGWRMVRDYRRVLSRLPYTIRSYQGKAWLEYAAAVAHCERVMSAGVPVLSAISKALDRQLPTLKFRDSFLDSKMLYKLGRERITEDDTVTDTARVSYAAAFGISTHQQVELEKLILAHDWVSATHALAVCLG